MNTHGLAGHAGQANMSRLTHLVSIVLAVAALSLTGCVSHQPATIRVLTYNIHHGEGMDGVIDLERIANVIRQTEADLVALQEVDLRRGGMSRGTATKSET